MKKQKRTFWGLLALGLCILLSGPMMAQREASPRSGAVPLSAMDKKFVMEAAQGGMAEVALGRLASERAATDPVKQFGQRMVDDHSKVNDELKRLADDKSLTLPTDMGKKHQAMRNRLSGLHGAAFDSAYMKEMVKDHKKDVAAFRKASRQCQDPDIKAFAAHNLPTLEDHLRMAMERSGKTSSASYHKRQKKGH